MRISPEEWKQHLVEQKAVEGRQQLQAAAEKLGQKTGASPEAVKALVNHFSNPLSETTIRGRLPNGEPSKGLKWGKTITTARDQDYCLCGQKLLEHTFDKPGISCPYKPVTKESK